MAWVTINDVGGVRHEVNLDHVVRLITVPHEKTSRVELDSGVSLVIDDAESTKLGTFVKRIGRT